MTSEHSPPGLFDRIERTAIAVLLGLMTLITFANVLARYVFDSNILWALEATVFLFAWLVLLGASYGVKASLHIGVDILVNSLGRKSARAITLFAWFACLVYTVLLLKGSWDYWYPFVTERAWLETDDVPMPEFLQFFADIFNEGERYEKIPRFIPYMALPIGLALMLFRYLQLGFDLMRGTGRSLVASHEAEDIVPDAPDQER